MLRSVRIQNLVLIREAELELAEGLNAVTGETGAGKTIFAQAIGLLLGARGDAATVGAAADEAYVEAEFSLPIGFLDDDDLAAIADLRPDGEDDLILARRVRADGRSRAYAWGRSIAREDLALATERLIAMSGQFEQRRLSRPAYQLDLLDRFCGAEQLERRRLARAVWRELGAARRQADALTEDAAAADARLRELRALMEATDGLEEGTEDALRAESARLRHVTELMAGIGAAVNAVDPDDGDGATSLAVAAERAIRDLTRVAPELSPIVEDLRDVSLRLRDTGGELRAILASLDVDPTRMEVVEGQLDAIADTRRRFGATGYGELLSMRDAARREVDRVDAGEDPRAAAAAAVSALEARFAALVRELRGARLASAELFGERVGEGLRDVGMGDGEFEVVVGEREPGPTGADDVAFRIRPNAGLPFAPVAETASGGELSRIALAIAAVAGGETMVFDEIDAGIGGETAHRVAALLRSLSERAQVITITHLPQIASAADRQFVVEKVPGDPTHTRITQLGDAERADELARMLGGREFAAALASREQHDRSP